MKWVNREKALKFPEGSAVVIARPVNPPSYEKHHIYEVAGWFRPDHIPQNRFGKGDEKYLLLEKPLE